MQTQLHKRWDDAFHKFMAAPVVDFENQPGIIKAKMRAEANFKPEDRDPWINSAPTSAEIGAMEAGLFILVGLLLAVGVIGSL